ncbi:unnamed protein product [Rotaria sp. Silwood2]|nr:unnamed protein product [Rotaria sp. Silwood2]
MPVILTQNIVIELGLINGMNGIFRQLVYEEDSASTNVLPETCPNNTRYIHKRLYTLIEIIKSKIECNLEQLQPNIIPIPVMEETFRIDIADVLPKKKRSKSNQKAILSIKQRPLPLVPAYSITTYKSLGQTLNNVVIDLKLSNETDDIAAIYVPLSRVQRLTDLIILGHFDHKVLLRKPTTKPYFQANANEIHTLNSKDIEMALDNNSKRTYNTGSNSVLNKLLQHIKTVGGRVMGSAYSRTALRTRIHALIFNQGLPSIFLTLNPADTHSPVALYFAGVKLNLDNVQNEQLMDTYRRAEIIASHPVSTAKFFHLLITNILGTMIMGGVLGPVKAYFGTVESQGPGSLHLHLLIWLDHDMKPADMKEKIQDATFRNKLKAYLEDIIKEDLDDFKDKQVIESSDVVPRSFNTPTRLSQDNIYTALRTIDLTGFAENTDKFPIPSTPAKQYQSSPSISYRSPIVTPLPQTPAHDRSTIDMNISYNQLNLLPACLPTPNPSSPNFISRFRADVTQLVESGNTHKHSDRCYKYYNANRGNKKICCMRMPRKLVPVSTIDPDTGHISMRRSDPWINNFNEYLISACRSNIDIKFIWTGSDAKALVYYITDYITKMSLSFHDTFSLVQKSITSLQKFKQSIR